MVIVDNDGDENEGHTHKVHFACFFFSTGGVFVRFVDVTAVAQ